MGNIKDIQFESRRPEGIDEEHYIAIFESGGVYKLVDLERDGRFDERVWEPGSYGSGCTRALGLKSNSDAADLFFRKMKYLTQDRFDETAWGPKVIFDSCH